MIIDDVAVCSTMSNGVFALFVVTTSSTQRSIESFASSFNMPYVTPSAPNSPTPSSWSARHNASTSFTLYLRPTYHQAVVDIIRVYRWTKIYYIYDDNDGTSYLKLLSTDQCCVVKDRTHEAKAKDKCSASASQIVQR